MMTINAAMRALVAELVAGDVPDPLSQAFTLAAIWCDLARLAGEIPPATVAALVEEETIHLPERVEAWMLLEEPYATAVARRFGRG